MPPRLYKRGILSLSSPKGGEGRGEEALNFSKILFIFPPPEFSVADCNPPSPLPQSTSALQIFFVPPPPARPRTPPSPSPPVSNNSPPPVPASGKNSGHPPRHPAPRADRNPAPPAATTRSPRSGYMADY